METSQLVQDFPPLQSLPLIKKEIQAQDAATENGSNAVQPVATVTDLNDVVSQRFAAEPSLTPSPSPTPRPSPTPTPNPTPTPSPTPSREKFGALQLIASSNLSVIDTGTVIQTDPTITRNGETGFGKIYRGSAQDGAPSAYFFGATSAFDKSSGFDAHFSDASSLPIAAFKFQSLQLAGDPTISRGSSGPPNLALISVGDLTSGPPGGLLTFTGIQQLLLATQNGSITLGPNLSFLVPALYVYARGATSDLTVDASFLGTGDLFLQAEGNLQATNSLSLVQAANDQQAGNNISLLAGEELKIGGDLAVITGASGAETGGNLLISSGGNMTIGGAFELLVFAAPESTGGTGGDIMVRSGGSLTAGSLNFILGNLTGGTGGENLLLDVAGDLRTTAGGVNLILVNAPSVPTGGFLATDLSTNAGGNIASATIDVGVAGDLVTQSAAVVEILNSGASQIGGNAVMNIAATGNINVQGDAFFDIVNTAEAGGDVLIDGGAIGENAGVSFSAGNVQTEGIFEIGILNNDQRFLNGAGQIGGNANLTLEANDLSSAGFFNLVINNEQGLIGGDSSIDARAASISTDDIFFTHIFNGGGGIGEGASVSVVTTGAISAGSDAIFEISNPGGAIGGDATLNINAADITAGGVLSASIDNTEGSIGGNAAINLNVSGKANLAGDATLQIVGSDNTAATAINLNGGTYDAIGTFSTVIDGNGTIGLNNATINADVLKVGVFGPNGILNVGGGTLSADTTLKLYAPGSNGSINFVADVTLSSQSTAAVIAASTVTIVNGVLVTIAGQTPASVFTDVPNYARNSGGNGTTTGGFGGSGAVTSPLSQAPPFDGFVSSGQLKLKKGDGRAPSGPKVKVSKNVEIPGGLSRGPRTVDRNPPVSDRSNPPSESAKIAAINLESSSQLLDLLDGAAPAAKKGKVIVDARPAPKAGSGKDSGKADPGTANASSTKRAAGDVKSSRDRPLDSIRRPDRLERNGQGRGGELPSSRSPAPALALR